MLLQEDDSRAGRATAAAGPSGEDGLGLRLGVALASALLLASGCSPATLEVPRAEVPHFAVPLHGLLVLRPHGPRYALERVDLGPAAGGSSS